MENIRRLFSTTRHLSARQIATRVRVLALRRWWRITRATSKLRHGARLCPDAIGCWPIDLKTAVAVMPSADFRRAEELRRDLEAGDFCFLESRVRFGDRIDWQAPTEARLWRYHLQYFGWVPSLIIADADGSGRGAVLFRAQILSWIEGNRALRGDGWHPYTLSLRIVNWLKGWAAWHSILARDVAFSTRFIGHLADQVHRLEQQLEFDVRGNHLMENVRALFWAGAFFSGNDAARWRIRAQRIFKTEISEQVLDDGAHFERTPGYHTAMLALLCEIAVLAKRNGMEAPIGCLEAIRRMGQFLQAILGPDGRIPLIKDTAYDAATSPPNLLWIVRTLTGDSGISVQNAPSLEAQLLMSGITSPVEKTERRLLVPDPKVSGFFVHASRRDFLLMDCGQPCPEYLPAHAHADALSYEFHLDGRSVIVDSGVFEYTAGSWRDYFRSTRAHNTVEVMKQNSSDVWASFRVARRACVLCCRSGRWQTAHYVIAEHDGYRYLPQKVRHRRCVVHLPDEFLAVLDLLDGIGAAEMTSFVHFHPEISCGIMGESLRLQHDGATIGALRPINAARISLHRGEAQPRLQGWYSERFGEKVPNTALAIVAHEQLPQLFGYVLAPHEVQSVSLAMLAQRAELRLRVGERDFHLAWGLNTNEVT